MHLSNRPPLLHYPAVEIVGQAALITVERSARHADVTAYEIVEGLLRGEVGAEPFIVEKHIPSCQDPDDRSRSDRLLRRMNIALFAYLVTRRCWH